MNKLEYIDLFIDGRKVKCLKDSGSELIILNKALFPDKQSAAQLQIKSCFGEVVNAEKASFRFALREGEVGVELTAAVCPKLMEDAIFPPSVSRIFVCGDHRTE